MSSILILGFVSYVYISIRMSCTTTGFALIEKIELNARETHSLFLSLCFSPNLIFASPFAYTNILTVDFLISSIYEQPLFVWSIRSNSGQPTVLRALSFLD